jgi:hypothetical protein
MMPRSRFSSAVLSAIVFEVHRLGLHIVQSGPPHRFGERVGRRARSHFSIRAPATLVRFMRMMSVFFRRNSSPRALRCALLGRCLLAAEMTAPTGFRLS